MIHKITIHNDRNNQKQQTSSTRKRAMNDIKPISAVKRSKAAQVSSQQAKAFQQKKLERRVMPQKPLKVTHKSQAVATALPIRNPHRKVRGVIILFAIFVVFGLLYGVLALFGSMSVVITPKENAFRLKQAAEFSLPQEMVTVSKTATQEFLSQTKQALNKKASGEIMVYNAYNSKNQVLVANTRFESPSGKIYRIKEKIIIPGATIKNGEIVPSSITVRVYADESGEAYNTDAPTDFTIPGFKGSPRYTKFYGRSQEKISGGFNGEASIVGEREASEALEQLERAVRSDLENQLQGAVPDGFIALENTKKITINSRDVEPNVREVGERFSVAVDGTASLVLVKKEDLEKNLESVLFDNFPEERNQLELSSYSIVKAKNPDFDGTEELVHLQIDGELAVIWLPNIQALRGDMLKSRVSEIRKVLQNYESIASAEVSFSPSWWRKIPKKSSKIRISIKK